MPTKLQFNGSSYSIMMVATDAPDDSLMLLQAEGWAVVVPKAQFPFLEVGDSVSVVLGLLRVRALEIPEILDPAGVPLTPGLILPPRLKN